MGEYLKETNKEKIKVLSIDSTFIENKNGIDNAERNIYYKIKRGKITAIVDTKGVPLMVNISEGNRHDCKLFEKTKKIEEK